MDLKYLEELNSYSLGNARRRNKGLRRGVIYHAFLTALRKIAGYGKSHTRQLGYKDEIKTSF